MAPSSIGEDVGSVAELDANLIRYPDGAFNVLLGTGVMH
jgi:hypothetical protein